MGPATTSDHRAYPADRADRADRDDRDDRDDRRAGQPANGLVPEVERIAVLRANALGDLLFALPALDALRAAYPGARLTLLGRAWHAGFLDGRPGPVDEVVALPDGLPEAEDGAPELVGALADRRFDLALQLHGGGRHSNPFVRRLGARVTAGLRTPDAEPLDRWVPYVYYQHEVLRLLEVATVVGAPMRSITPTLAVTDRDREEADAALPTCTAPPGPLAVLHPGATDPRRRWPAASFAEVGDALASAGARVVVTGDRSEAALVEEVAGRMGATAVALPGTLSLPALTGLLARAAVVVANDTGPLHLAAAVGTPTVGVFWCGNLINAGPPTRARHRPAVSWRLHCPVCGTDCTRAECDHRDSFVADVEVSEVRSSALDLLSSGR